MPTALHIARSGLDAQQTRLSVVSNNLANVSTTAFKKGRPAFEDLLYQTVNQPGANSSQSTELPSGLMLGLGVRTVATGKIFTQGTLQQTDNNLDMAIQGRGFFSVLMPDGSTSFTRDGTLSLNSQGQMVTSSGYTLDPSITIPAGTQSVTIGSDGTVSALAAGAAAPTQIGSVLISDFINPQGLQPIGENLYKETVSSGSPTQGTPGLNGLGTLVQGSIEGSNVNPVEELVNLIETQRSYEMNSKAIKTVDEMMQFVTQTL
ncbi:MAG: flagellar basal-body rod protein FlgG [Gammaproteobacteria bacterium]|jgi:flagellar basal-body rod protein FlgG|nr:flagellar basal-body rod protein FlgG [Gammaproteobacteria bacterium]